MEKGNCRNMLPIVTNFSSRAKQANSQTSKTVIQQKTEKNNNLTLLSLCLIGEEQRTVIDIKMKAKI